MDQYVKDSVKSNIRIILFGIVALILIYVAFVSIFAFPTNHFPSEGEWYCDALDLQIALEKDGESFQIWNDEKIECSIIIHRGSTWIYVICQETDNAYYDLGECVFFGEIVSCKDDFFVIRGDDGAQYTFNRIN